MPTGYARQHPETNRQTRHRAQLHQTRGGASQVSDELAVLLGKRFIERRDVKARQFNDGSGWAPDRDKANNNLKWNMTDLRHHVAGEMTFGHYMVSLEGNTKLFAFDIDLKKVGWTMPVYQEGEADEEKTTNLDAEPCNPREVWLDVNNPGRTWLTIQLRCCADSIAERTHKLFDVPVAIATSGCKGLHVYGFTGTIPAEEARAAAITVLESFTHPDGSHWFVPTKGVNFYGRPEDERTNLEIEVFPKQDNLDQKEFGNLMKLPLGIHRKTGARSRFIRSDVPYEKLVTKDATAVLEGELPWE